MTFSWVCLFNQVYFTLFDNLNFVTFIIFLFRIFLISWLLIHFFCCFYYLKFMANYEYCNKLKSLYFCFCFCNRDYFNSYLNLQK